MALTDDEEVVIWEGSPAFLPTHFWFAIIGTITIVPIPYVLYLLILTKSRRYRVTNERIQLKEGIFNKKVEELELYRVKDSTLKLPLGQRIFGKGTIEMLTSDRSHPTFSLEAVPDPEALRDKIRDAVEVARSRKNVREVDYE